MPQSRNRHRHPTHEQPHDTEAKPRRSVALILAILAAILGLAVGYFAQGADPVWMLTGATAGLILGYLVGHNIDKAIKKTGD